MRGLGNFGRPFEDFGLVRLAPDTGQIADIAQCPRSADFVAEVGEERSKRRLGVEARF